MPRRRGDACAGRAGPIAAAGEILTIPVGEIRSLSFDGRHWWWPFDPRGGTDDPGALEQPGLPGMIVDRYLLGELSTDVCEQQFSALGLHFDLLGSGGDDPSGGTDNPGDLGPATDDHGAADAGD